MANFGCTQTVRSTKPAARNRGNLALSLLNPVVMVKHAHVGLFGRLIPAKLIDVCVDSKDRSVGWPCFDIVVLMLMS